VKVEKISAVAEIISSVAIVITLIYLTVETRQNTDALLAMSQQAALDADLSWLSTQIEYPELMGQVDDPNLSQEDWARTQAYLVQYLRIREFAWFQYQNGILDEPTWQSYLRPTANVFASERARTYLYTGNYSGDPEFMEYLRNWFAEARAKKP